MADVNMLKQRCDVCRTIGLAGAAVAIVIVGWVILGAILPLWLAVVLMVIAAPVLLFMVDEHCLSWAYRTIPAPAIAATPEPVKPAVAESAAPVVEPEPEIAPEKPAMPPPAAPVAEAPAISARQVQSAPAEAAPDDLKKIKGVGPKLEEKLHGLGIYHYHQIAAWSEADAASVDDKLSFKGRVARDGWIDQAKALMGKEG